MINRDHLNEIIKERLRYCTETGHLIWVANEKVAGSVERKGYISIHIGRCTVKAHQIVWFFNHGVWPTEQIDHIDEDKANNLISNLREVSGSINQHNITKPQSNNTTGFRGVFMNREKFAARIHIDGVIRNLGSFDTAQRASNAYQDAKLKYVS